MGVNQMRANQYKLDDLASIGVTPAEIRAEQTIDETLLTDWSIALKMLTAEKARLKADIPKLEKEVVRHKAVIELWQSSTAYRLCREYKDFIRSLMGDINPHNGKRWGIYSLTMGKINPATGEKWKKSQKPLPDNRRHPVSNIRENIKNALSDRDDLAALRKDLMENRVPALLKAAQMELEAAQDQLDTAKSRLVKIEWEREQYKFDKTTQTACRTWKNMADAGATVGNLDCLKW